jgi:uncharacterized membrane protein YjgN (DUF898 family)
MIVAPPSPAPESESPLSPPQPPAAPQLRVYQVTFTGNAREYFRIWIVNLFLSVITLGIYSPWAKVRKKRYFCGNTWIADANFDYHGNPIAILKGRLIAVLALVAYNAAGHYLPRLGTGVLLALMAAAPWLIVRSLQFNAENTSYRNLRFHFHGRYREGLRAIAPLLLSPFLALVLPAVQPGTVPRSGLDFAILLAPSIPFMVFYPYVVASVKRFQVRNSTYGSAPFAFSAPTEDFYIAYFLGGLIFIAGAFVAGFAAVAALAIPAAGWVAVPVAYLFAGSIFFGYTRSRIGNITFNATRLDGNVRFVSKLSALKLGWIYFGNLLAMSVSFGLLVPWAVMRTARYRASCLNVDCAGDLDGFVADVSRPIAATGEQLGEFFDVDLSL